ncbi:MAG TPA: tetratricopeptide repeat protein [Actinoplanes sp.]
MSHAFASLPDPGAADSLDGVADGLRQLKIWAGEPSYETIKDRINGVWRTAGRPAGELARRATVADCFKAGRRRLNTELVIAIVRALHPDPGYAAQWQQALRVIGGEAKASAQVRVQGSLPQDLPGFVGRTVELDLLRRALAHGPVAISAIAGMAGVGKTQLAIHAGHRFTAEGLFDRVLFVNLRGFHPDAAQPPADPAAVLDGFLRQLGVSGQRIPHDRPARTAMFRTLLAGTRTLVVLDNAASVDQVRPLLPATPGCPALITSRRDLGDLDDVTRLVVDVFTAGEAVAFLTRAARGTPVGGDPAAAARIARRCGYLPLALGIVAGHIRGATGWTLTEHADRLDERQHNRRLDTGVQLAFDESYAHLSDEHQRFLRLTALHPGPDFDAYAAATLVHADLTTATARLGDLLRDHLVQQTAAGRYTFHDLIRAYASERAADEEPPSARQAALTRMFDYYLATAAGAMDTLYPAEAEHRPRVPTPDSPTPLLPDPRAALAWLDSERPTLVALAETQDWPGHVSRLSPTLYRYLDGGHALEAFIVHGRAHRAAELTGDLAAQAHALNGVGTAHLRVGQYGPAVDHLRQAQLLFEKADDPAGQARALGSLGNIAKRQGRFAEARADHQRAIVLFRRAGELGGEARALRNLGVVEGRQGRHARARELTEQSLLLSRRAGDPIGEADGLSGLGEITLRRGDYQKAAGYFEKAIVLYREVGDHDSELAARDDLGIIMTRLGRPELAIEHHQAALAFDRASGDRDGQANVLNALGEATAAAGRPAESLAHHRDALDLAAEIGLRDQVARAHAGLGDAHLALNDRPQAIPHHERALALYTELGMPDAERVRAALRHRPEDVAGPDR